MRLFQSLFIAFLLIPVIEIYLLIKVGGVLGAIPTIFLVVFTAVLGAFLLRRQGLSTYQRAQRMLAAGELPTLAMLEGVVLLISGALLLTPGFFTDTIGFLGLVPPLRQAAIRALLARGLVRTVQAGGPAPGGRRGPTVIEGEYRHEKDPTHR
jgi:UPF0716 protein FxsA